MIEKCDEEIRKIDSGVDVRLSGTTCVCIYMDEHSIHVGSVGDSRSILGTTPSLNEDIPHPIRSKDKFRRSIKPRTRLTVLPLTVDQKPNHQEELDRITAAGGTVQPLSDENGDPVGPFRVWKKGCTFPGLAMSRSIGDSKAKRLGVIATPILNVFDICDNDQFIVLGSDGVW
jgi:serine/threonine protein phosphatase PrpC